MTENVNQQFWIIIDQKSNKIQILKAKIVKWGLFFVDLGYINIFLIAIVLAISIGPNGYNPYYNAISALGWSEITPFPFLFDLKAYLGSFLLILTVLFAKKKLIHENHLGDK
ncbi:hypothetical protein LCGC14_1593930 [marine sediment metagenome]|uniref:Uncharacterized protein n=1 Tax=marine sediment metagenome TaxID=412755 RepID=A0A0F9IDN6_9ZZZZ